MHIIVKILFCFLLVCLACKPDRQTATEGWKPVQRDTLHNLTAQASNQKDFQTLLQGYGFDEPDGRFLHYKKQSDSTAFLE